MPRRKKQIIKAKGLWIFQDLVSELSRNPELAEDYDMESIEIIIKKKIVPIIKDVDRVIKNLQHYSAANKQFIGTFNGRQLIFKKDLAKMMKVSRPTLDRWIKNGFIKPSPIPGISLESFQIDEVIEQLRKQKQ
jgi:hypothetical protein